MNQCFYCRQPYRTHCHDSGKCPSCLLLAQAEYMKVNLQCNRTRKQGLPSTLTVAEWLEVLNLFYWRCAYCKENPYEAIDHFIPVTYGGGTTLANCVPACRSCNAHKSGIHPDLLTTIPRHDIERVKAYLSRLYEFPHVLKIGA